MKDPVLDRIEKAQRQIMADCEGNLTQLVEQHAAWQEQHPDRLATLGDLCTSGEATEAPSASSQKQRRAAT